MKIQDHVRVCYSYIASGDLVRATWHLLKAKDILIWQSEEFKRTPEWEGWRLMTVASTRRLISAMGGAASPEYEVLVGKWLNWKLPVSADRAVVLFGKEGAR